MSRGAKSAREGERLLAAGELGLARLEFEAALEAAGLDAATQDEVRRRLADTRARLGWSWFEKGRRLAEADAVDEARAAFEVALSLAGDEGLEQEARAALERLDELVEGAAVAEVDAPHLSLDPLHPIWRPVTVREPELAELAATPGDEPEGEAASALDLALVSYPAGEAAELRRLAEADAAIAAALVLQSEGDGAAARERWQAAGEAAAAGIARREWARACLISGDTEEAARRLAEAPAGDDGVRELALELSLLAGRREEAAARAREILASGRVRDLTAVSEAAAAAGAGEEALAAVDGRLDHEPQSLRWWRLRARVCEILGSAEGLREADERTVELYLAGYVSDNAENREFPLDNASRMVLALVAQATAPARARARALAQLLVAHDPERRGEWQALRRELRE